MLILSNNYTALPVLKTLNASASPACVFVLPQGKLTPSILAAASNCGKKPKSLLAPEAKVTIAYFESRFGCTYSIKVFMAFLALSNSHSPID